MSQARSVSLVCPWSMSRPPSVVMVSEHEPPPAHASAKAILSHHLGDAMEPAHRICPALPCLPACHSTCCLPWCLFACLHFALPKLWTNHEPLNNLPLARTADMARTHWACVCVVSCRACR